MLALRPQPYFDGIPWNNQVQEEKRSPMLEWYRSMIQPAQIPTPIQSAVTGVRSNAEGAVVGAVLGFIKGEFGTLDIHDGRIPLDGVAAVLLYALSVREANKPDGYASDLRALSQSCTTVLSFRKVEEWRASANGRANVRAEEKVSADIPRNIDPIVAAGKALGLDL